MNERDRVRIVAGPHVGRAGLVVSTHDCVVAGLQVVVRLFEADGLPECVVTVAGESARPMPTFPADATVTSVTVNGEEVPPEQWPKYVGAPQCEHRPTAIATINRDVSEGSLHDRMVGVLLDAGIDAETAWHVAGRLCDVAVETLASEDDRRAALCEWLARSTGAETKEDRSA